MTKRPFPNDTREATQTSNPLSVTFDDRAFARGTRRIVILERSDEGEELVVEQSFRLFNDISEIIETVEQVVVFDELTISLPSRP